MQKENITQMKPEISDFFKKRVKKQAVAAEVIQIDSSEIEIDPLLLPNPPVPEEVEVVDLVDETEVIEIEDEQDGLDKVSNDQQRHRSSRHGSKPRPSYYINMDVLAMDDITRSTIIKNELSDCSFSEKPKSFKKSTSIGKKKKGSINPLSFFMTPKERIEHAQIERSLKMQTEMMEATKLSNQISQASGKAWNPFFNPRMPKPVVEADGERVKVVAQPLAPTICPYPDRSQSHVGWTWQSSRSMPTSSYAWANKSAQVCNVSIFEGDYTVNLQSANIETTIFHDKLLNIKKDRLLELVAEHYSGFAQSIPTTTQWFTEQVQSLDFPSNNLSLAWTDACSPKGISSIVGLQNRKVCQNITDWLQTWSTKPEKFGCFKKKIKSDKKRKRTDDFIASDEESELDYSMSSDNDFDDSRVTVGYEPVNMILGESGKTMVAHVAANIAGYHVLELNTSTKRNGKILIDVLTSATTTHTVKTKRGNEDGFCLR